MSGSTGLAARLREGPVVVLDGGLGSMLVARGLSGGEAPELWNLDRPDDVAAVHRAYVDAGSEAVHTNTFGATPIRLAPFGLADRCEAINQAAVQLAREAGPRFVLGDVGPTGEYLAPVGDGDLIRWRESFSIQGAALAAAGVDAFHVETMSDLREAEVALDALREVAPDTPVLVSLTFDRKRRGFFTVMGNRVGGSLQRLSDAGAVTVGANCSLVSEDMADLAAEARAAVEAPLVFQANAGQPRMTEQGTIYDQTPAAFAWDVAAMASAGAAAVGGCCGTDPRFIAALCRALGGATA